MKKRGILLILLTLAIAISCKNDVANALDDLDAALESKEVYRQEFLKKLSIVRDSMSVVNNDSLKWKYANKLFNEFIHYSLDSASTYLSLMEVYCVDEQQYVRNQLAHVTVLYQKHMNTHAVETFNSINRKIAYSAALKKDYLSCALSLYKGLDRDSLNHYRCEYLAEDSLSVFGKKIHAQFLRDKGDLQTALKILHACDGTEDNYHDKTSTVYNIGMIYDLLGDKDKKKIYLARSGVYDMLAPNRDYMSIYQLALELYEEGDLKRANKYIESNLMDVIGGGFDQRMINSGKAHQVITAATYQTERERTHLVIGALITLTILVVVISFLLLYTRKQSRRLKESHKQLSVANSKIKKQNINLKEANLIKDNYVFRYMDMSIKYIEKLEQLKHDIRHDLKKKPVEVVIKELRNPSEIYDEYKSFYQIFDEIFLGIFPDFREKVNELLHEEHRIPIPPEKILTTEQRILAVIRLGITESGKIASFLNCAPPTIYTYRTKMRNAAVCSKEDFDEKIRHL